MQSPPRNKSAAPPKSPSGIERKASGRARDLLRQHYGLGGLPVPTASGKANDPLDIGWCVHLSWGFTDGPPLDSPAFDSWGYYQQLVATSSLPTLLKRENGLFEGK